MKAAIFLLLAIGIASGCVLEIRETTFYPNGTQEIGRDWVVVNFTNNYPYEIYDVQISEIARIPAVLPGQNVKIDPYLEVPPREFPIAFKAIVEDLGEKSRIVYVVENYGEDLRVLVSFPKFEVLECEGCMIGEVIEFDLNIPANSSKSFSITTTSDFEIPDGEVSFNLTEKKNLSFGFKLPISVEKGHEGKWIARFKTYNPIDREIELYLNAWAEVCGKRLEILNESLKLEVGASFFNSTELESPCVPVFFLKAKATAEELCTVEIIPSHKVGGSYVIGYALLKGFSHFSPPITPSPAPRIAPPIFVYTPAPPPTPPPAVQPTGTGYTTISPELNIPYPKPLPIELAVTYAITLVPATFGAFAAMVFFPVFNRRGVVLSGRNAEISRLLYSKFRIYTIPSNPVRGGILVEPEEGIVSALLSWGLEIEDAELIAVAIKVKKPLIARNRMTAQVALSLGVPVIGYGRS